LREALAPRDGFAIGEAALREALAPRDRSKDMLTRDTTLRPPQSLRDGLASRESALREALSPRDNLGPKDSLPRDTATSRPPLRDGLATQKPLSRDAATPRPPAPPREGLASRESPLRDALRPATPPRETMALRDALASRPTAPVRDAFSLLDMPPSRDSRAKGDLVFNSAPRSLLDEAADLGLAPSRETNARWETDPAQAPTAPAPAIGTEALWKRKKRSAEVFEGDAALKELRSRLAAVPTDQTPEPPMAPAKTPIFASAVRLMGVVGLAAGGALGFLWITSPHGPRSAGSQGAEEYALVSLSSVEPSKPSTQSAAPERMPDPSPSADQQPWSVANLTSEAATKAAAPPVVPQPRVAAGPPRSPVTHRTAALPSSPVQPAPAAAVSPAPPPAPVPAPVAAVATPTIPAAAVVSTPLDRDEINAMLLRARTFLSSGDVAAARVVLRRAAASDDPQAALALGGTYDPGVLRKLGIISFHADPAQAREWYRKAASLGSADASLRLEQLVQTDR
jgi:hypothetical protein